MPGRTEGGGVALAGRRHLPLPADAGPDLAPAARVRLQALELVNFRSWSKLSLTFPGDHVALVGSNASGKTSVLEAVWYVATLGSHRASADAGLVRQGETAAVIRATVDHEGRP